MTVSRKNLGRKGERIAERFLKTSGHRILARNYSAPQGELDLVAQSKRDGRILFVEVKTRTSESVARAEQAVGREKQRHIIRTAQAYLKAKRIPDDTPLRFDVIAVIFAPDGKPEVRHTPDAFTA